MCFFVACYAVIPIADPGSRPMSCLAAHCEPLSYLGCKQSQHEAAVSSPYIRPISTYGNLADIWGLFARLYITCITGLLTYLMTQIASNPLLSSSMEFNLGHCTVLALLAYGLFSLWRHRGRQLPPGPPPYPLIGNIPHMTLDHPERRFHLWKKKYGIRHVRPSTGALG